MNWSKESPILMTLEGNWWTVKVNLSNEKLPIAYKYGVYDLRKKEFVAFEGGDNRMLYDGQVQKQVTILHDGFVRLSNTSWKGAGVAIPVFSLRTARSFGVGEFTDLKLLSDWAAATGLKLIQILPVNDTTSTHTWEDSYPYKAISAFAMHPLYLDLDKVAGKEHASILKPLPEKAKSVECLTRGRL
jgi:4-alpha-glucanotransferase